MDQPKLSLAIIARDREIEIERGLASVSPHVDEIVVVDTGSRDKTVEVARKFGAKILFYTPETNPEGFFLDAPETFERHNLPGPWSGKMALGNFSIPRNMSFEACTGDYIMWIDTDDVVVGAENIRKIVNIMATEDIKIGMFRYDYDHDAEGNVVITQVRERIIKNKSGISWINPIHEHLSGFRKGMLFEDVYVKHDRKVVAVSKERVDIGNGVMARVVHADPNICYRNVKTMLHHMDEMEKCDKPVQAKFYYLLGSEMRNIDEKKAEKIMDAFIEKGDHPEDVSHAHMQIAHLYEVKGKWDIALDRYKKSLAVFNRNPAALLGIARCLFAQGDAAGCIKATETGFKIYDSGTVHSFLQPMERKYRALGPYAAALTEVGQWKKALEVCDEGLALVPNCPQLGSLKEYTRSHIAEAA